MTAAYTAARVFDGESERAIEDGAVVVEDERIASVPGGHGSAARYRGHRPRGRHALPGLIDAHGHLVWNASAEPHELVARESRALTALRCAQNAAVHIKAGVTTVRDTGATDALSVDVARAMELGVLPGPGSWLRDALSP